MKTSRGYTLVELIVALGIFAIVMLLATGAYLAMIAVQREAQGLSLGINNLSFALEDMTRSARTGTHYNCNSSSGGNCSGGGTALYFTDSSGAEVSYTRTTSSSYCGSSGNGCLVKTIGGNTSTLTDASVNITSLTFYVSGVSSSDTLAPHVTIVVGGTVSTRAGKTQTFSVETGATMRGTDL